MSSRDVTVLTPKPGITATTGMLHPGLPPVLAELLTARDEGEREAAWARFVAAHTGLLLHTCNTVARDRDGAMDGYAYILDALREENCHRLRAYEPDPRTRFTTWLVVVARRLLLDHHRHRYGRPRNRDDAHRAEHIVRRRLEDLVAVELDPAALATGTGALDAALIQNEVSAALAAAIASLDPADRLMLALRFEDERPVREIAATLALPSVFHVYRRLGVVLARLKRTLVARGVDAADS